LAEPLMKDGGSIITLTYYGAEKVAKNYGIMGPCKAALEALTRSLAADLGPKRITVNALSAGAIKTRAASGIVGFSDLQQMYIDKIPLPDLADQDDVGAMAALLFSQGGRAITGQTIYIDSGFSAMA